MNIFQEAVDAVAQYGDQVKAATALGLSRTTLQSRYREACTKGITPSAHIEDLNNPAHLKLKLKRALIELKHAKDQALDHDRVKRTLLKLDTAAAQSELPGWLLKAPPDQDGPGVPSLFLSDLHWGERVSSSQINGVNAYDLTIARQRLSTLATRAVRLLAIISPKMEYPGLVLNIGGDCISGNIHDELTATNELNSMPVMLDLFEHGGQFIQSLADIFPRVHCVIVSGNHGRDTTKIWHKDRHHTSFDWLLGCLWAKHFTANPKVTFQIPDGPDAYYKIFNHRYLLTHGDQFRGGDGMIGALGPIIRGDHKKRSRNAQIDMEYDTLLMGHWHQYVHLTRLIVNGSLKGYDEYAYANNFPFEAPQQALWLTHPKYGITYRMPVYVDKERRTPIRTTWLSMAR